MLLSLVFLSQVLAALTESSRRCSEGYSDGDQVDRGRYWYECRDGQFVQKGCLAPDYRRMNVLDTYDDSGVRMQCSLNEDGNLVIAYKSCVNQGREYEINDQWEDSKNYFLCKKERDYVKIDLLGCIDDGKRIAVNEKIIKSDFVYQCRKTLDDSFAVVRIGCYADGVRYRVGENFERSRKWYVCTTSGSGSNSQIIADCLGCVHESRRIADQEHLIEGDVVYACMVDGENTRLKAIGCVSRNKGVVKENRLDCLWMEGEMPYQYEYQCRAVPNSDTAVKAPVKCNFNGYTVNPGCFRFSDGFIVGCVQQPNDQILIRIFKMNQVEELPRQGLKFC